MVESLTAMMRGSGAVDKMRKYAKGIPYNAGQEKSIIIEGIDRAEYPKLCDAYVSFAKWEDTGTELTPSELIQFQEDNNLKVHELALERVF